MPDSSGRKLTIELVPKTSWGNSLNRKMPRKEWDKIRKRTYAEYGHRCGICGADARLNCHEIWEYDDTEQTQTLKGFIALCNLCHHVKHLGFAQILAQQGQLDYEAVISHYMTVNGVDRQTFLQDRKAAFAQWEERSMHPWTVDTSIAPEVTAEA